MPGIPTITEINIGAIFMMKIRMNLNWKFFFHLMGRSGQNNKISNVSSLFVPTLEANSQIQDSGSPDALLVCGLN